MRRQKLGDLLVAAGVLTGEQLATALREQERWGGRLGQILVAKSFVTEEVLVRALSSQLRVDVAVLGGRRIPAEVLRLVPADLAREHVVIPIGREASILDLAMANPLDLGITDELRIRTRLNVRAFIAGDQEIRDAIRLHYGATIPLQVERARPAVSVETVETPEVTRLQERVTRLEGLLGRNEDVLRKVLRLLVDKDVASRDEILTAIR